MKKISSFKKEYKFLSNFYAVPIEYDCVIYRTVEHAFQAAKTLNYNERVVIRQCATPAEAKYFGKYITLRDDWEEVKISIMTELVRQKFGNEYLKKKLIETGDSILIEGNTHHDTFWGVCDGVGENNLGKIIMKVRNEII